MTTEASRLPPLPEPDCAAVVVDMGFGGKEARWSAYSPSAMTAYAQQATAALQAELQQQALVHLSSEGQWIEHTGKLAAELAEVRRDAERWRAIVRWTTTRCETPDSEDFSFSFQPHGYNGGSFGWVEFGWPGPKWKNPTAEQMNTAIDAAIDRARSTGAATTKEQP